MYQGKEVDEELGLNWLDFHARMYDPVLGRWHVQDPMLQHASPYQAMGNNPVSRVDPNGMWDGGFDAFLAQRSEENRRLNLAHGQWLGDNFATFNGDIDHEATQNSGRMTGMGGVGYGNRSISLTLGVNVVATFDGESWSATDKVNLLNNAGLYIKDGFLGFYTVDAKMIGSNYRLTKDGAANPKYSCTGIDLIYRFRSINIAFRHERLIAEFNNSFGQGRVIGYSEITTGNNSDPTLVVIARKGITGIRYNLGPIEFEIDKEGVSSSLSLNKTSIGYDIFRQDRINIGSHIDVPGGENGVEINYRPSNDVALILLGAVLILYNPYVGVSLILAPK